jgi:hypothetical protein
MGEHLTIRVSDALLSQLEALAARQQVTASDVVRQVTSLVRDHRSLKCSQVASIVQRDLDRGPYAPMSHAQSQYHTPSPGKHRTL